MERLLERVTSNLQQSTPSPGEWRRESFTTAGFFLVGNKLHCFLLNGFFADSILKGVDLSSIASSRERGLSFSRGTTLPICLHRRCRNSYWIMWSIILLFYFSLRFVVRCAIWFTLFFMNAHEFIFAILFYLVRFLSISFYTLLFGLFSLAAASNCLFPPGIFDWIMDYYLQ